MIDNLANNNVYAIFQDMLEAYIRFYESQIYIRHPKIAQERSDLLRQEGKIFREPFLELNSTLPNSLESAWKRLLESWDFPRSYPNLPPLGCSQKSVNYTNTSLIP